MTTHDFLDKEIGNGGCSLVWHRVHLGPLCQIIDENHGILITEMRTWELNDINTNSVKRPRYCNRGQWRMHCSTGTMRVAYQTTTSPPRDVTSHTAPPVVTSQLTMDLHVAQMCTKYSTVCFIEELLSLIHRWDDTQCAVRLYLVVLHQ